MDMAEAVALMPDLESEADHQSAAFFFQGLDLLAQRGARPLGQLGQDAWILGAYGNEPGFFLEIGGGKARELSNTYNLQFCGNWRGVIVEPLPTYAEMHRDERMTDSVAVIEAAVSDRDGTALLVQNGELSSLVQHHQRDGHAGSRIRAFKDTGGIEVRSISPRTLMLEGQLPSVVDFLSVDVEGAELDILSHFPWSDVHVRYACVEHNHRSDESKIDFLLEEQGLKRVLRSWTGFDGWYVSTRRA